MYLVRLLITKDRTWVGMSNVPVVYEMCLIVFRDEFLCLKISDKIVECLLGLILLERTGGNIDTCLVKNIIYMLQSINSKGFKEVYFRDWE
jgi:hypothetical protein